MLSVVCLNLEGFLGCGIFCAQVLAAKLDGADEEQVWLDACNSSFAAMIKDKQSREAEEAKATASICPLDARMSLCFLLKSLWFA